jgi:phage tail protein X
MLSSADVAALIDETADMTLPDIAAADDTVTGVAADD